MRALLVVGVLVAGCAGPTRRTSSAPAAQQGIKGQVVKLLGDFTMDPPTGRRLPLAVPVHVFRGRLKPLDAPDPRHPALIRIVRPDQDGRFELALLPGEYTLVAEIGGKLYLNNWMDDGCWAIAVVSPGEWTKYTIEDVLEATF